MARRRSGRVRAGTRHASSKVTRTVDITGDFRPVESDIHKNIVAYRITYTETIVTNRNGRDYPRKPVTKTFTGVGHKKDFDKILSGKAMQIHEYADVRRNGWNSTILAVKPAYLELARTQGWHIDWAKAGDAYLNESWADPLTALENGEEVIFIESYSANHQLFDINGKPLPVCLYFSYMSGGFDNSRYDMLKAAKILRKRHLEVGDVCPLADGGEKPPWRHPTVPEDDPVHLIGRIPHYNADRNRERCVAFYWAPSDEDYQRMWNEAIKADKDPGKDQFYKTCFDLDMFGLRAGKAALYENYYSYANDENDDSDDEEDW